MSQDLSQPDTKTSATAEEADHTNTLPSHWHVHLCGRQRRIKVLSMPSVSADSLKQQTVDGVADLDELSEKFWSDGYLYIKQLLNPVQLRPVVSVPEQLLNCLFATGGCRRGRSSHL